MASFDPYSIMMHNEDKPTEEIKELSLRSQYINDEQSNILFFI